MEEFVGRLTDLWENESWKFNKVINEFAELENGSSVLDILRLNVFQDLLGFKGSQSLSQYDDEYAQSPEWQEVVAKWAPKAEYIQQELIKLHNAGIKLSDSEAHALDSTVYDGNDGYAGPEESAMELPRIYHRQLSAIVRFIKNQNDNKQFYEDWNKVNHHDKTNGLSQKAVNAYRREHPGSKLKTAVTTKPSKLKAGSKAAKRRKSFCARMSGNKGPMKKPNGKPTPKALALRRWNCESIEEMAQMIAEGEQMIAEIKKGQKDSNGFTKCWPGKHAEGTKKGKNGKPVRNCVPNESQGVAEAGPNAPYTPSPAKPFRNPRGFNKQGTGVGNKLADLNRKEWEEKKKKEQGVAEGSLEEKWTQKYKNSINCSNPKGFSQKAHCAGKKK